MRDWESAFSELWTQGLEITEIAQRLDIPKGTVQSRAHRLQQQGKIQPRGRGGAYPRQKALARQAPAPTAPPVPPTPPASPVPATPTVPAVTFVAVPEIQEMLSILRDLQTRVGELEQTRVPPALPAPQVPPAPQAPPVGHASPAPPATERQDIYEDHGEMAPQ
jgi:hypothetical protein